MFCQIDKQALPQAPGTGWDHQQQPPVLHILALHQHCTAHCATVGGAKLCISSCGCDVQLMDRNPEFAQVLNNPQQLQEAMQAATNPVSSRLSSSTFCDPAVQSALFVLQVVMLSHLLNACTDACHQGVLLSPDLTTLSIDLF